LQKVSRLRNEVAVIRDLWCESNDRFRDLVRKRDLASNCCGVVTRYRPERASHQRRQMASENLMGVGWVERTSTYGLRLKRREPELQLVRYESFVDPRREVRHGTTLRNPLLGCG
jgi:hypothetical protein